MYFVYVFDITNLHRIMDTFTEVGYVVILTRMLMDGVFMLYRI